MEPSVRPQTTSVLLRLLQLRRCLRASFRRLRRACQEADGAAPIPVPSCRVEPSELRSAARCRAPRKLNCHATPTGISARQGQNPTNCLIA